MRSSFDLLRPLLIARGLWDFSRWRLGRGTWAFLIAFALAPLSIPAIPPYQWWDCCCF
jgi:hypothetical protein